MFRMTVADVFFIHGRGLVATGRVEEGSVCTGDTVAVNGREVGVDGIEAFRKVLEEATVGDNVGLLMKGLDKDDVKAGDLITGDATALPDPPAPPSGEGWEQDFPGGLPR